MMKMNSCGGVLAAAVLGALFAILGSVSPASYAEKLQTLAPSGAAPGGTPRMALVIGNNAYKSDPLRNPVNDARAIARVLAETGFAVTVMEDATQIGMKRAIRRFGDELAKGGVGLFFYAGHGMQVKGRNYLIPVNAEIDREDEVEDQSVDVDLVLSKLESAKNALNIVILDACRNNPFARSFRSAAKGLAQMDAPSGTLVAFATAPGSVASDGPGTNGLYTSHLLASIRQPGLPIEQLFKQVRIGVTRDTKDKQVPWESSSLKGDFFFLPPDPSSAGATQKAQVDKAVADAVRQAEERAARERAEMQKKMEQMIAEALARQKAMLEAERKGQPAPAVATAPVASSAPAPAAATVPAQPVQVASIAPAAAVAKLSEAQTGDRFLYRGMDPNRPERKFESLVEVLGATPAGAIEVTYDSGGAATQWVYSPEPILVGFSNGFAMFSPFVGGAGSLAAGQHWRDLSFERMGSCNRGTFTCGAIGKVIGKEKVTVKAGTFDAYKIEIVVLGRQGPWAGSREHVFWYADAIQRIVKMTARSSGFMAIEHADFELVAYQRAGREAVGDFSTAVAIARQGGEPAPIVVASLATVPAVAPSGPAVPKAGDRWEYALRNSTRNETSKRVVEALEVGARGIQERITDGGTLRHTLVHPGSVALSEPGMIQLTPYLLAFGDRPVGSSLGDIGIVQFANCGTQECSLSGRVVAAEKVTVPAGTFDALKIAVNIRVGSGRFGASTIELTYWYAREAKRIIKGSGTGSGFAVTMPNFEFDLTTYRLQ